MRISDWSSDVCSSDLQPRLRAEFARVAAPLRAAARLRPGRAAGTAEPDPQRAPRDRPADLHLRRGRRRPPGARRTAGRRPAWGASAGADRPALRRSEEHTSELQSLMRISYAVVCLNKKLNEKQT